MNDLPRIICIAGPTGSGKTSAALHLAQELQKKGLPADIINADSRQVYKDFPVITAQPAEQERAVCAHKLYGWLPSDQKISAGEWARLALKDVEESLGEHHVPILVGGTGFYLKALLDGIASIPPADPMITQKLMETCNEKGLKLLYDRLVMEDPSYAQKIHPNDKQRIIRALEVLETTGQPFSWWHRQTAPPAPFNILRLGVGLPLSELTPMLSHRIDDMLNHGAIEEARQARQQCSDMSAPAWSGIGCMELAQFLLNNITLEEAKALWLSNTRAYAKRQWTLRGVYHEMCQVKKKPAS